MVRFRLQLLSTSHSFLASASTCTLPSGGGERAVFIWTKTRRCFGPTPVTLTPHFKATFLPSKMSWSSWWLQRSRVTCHVAVPRVNGSCVSCWTISIFQIWRFRFRYFWTMLLLWVADGSRYFSFDSFYKTLFWHRLTCDFGFILIENQDILPQLKHESFE